MKKIFSSIIFIAIIILVSTQSCTLLKNATAEEAFARAKEDDPNYVAVEGEKESENKKETEWPPRNIYSLGTLGYALQGQFKGHYNACSGKPTYDTLDYVPNKFRNIRSDFSLNTKVETFYSSSGNVLFYVFDSTEITSPFNTLKNKIIDTQNKILSPERVIGLNVFNYSTAILKSAPGYPGFLLRQSCSGYLDASLNVNLKPPFSSIKASLSADADRKSSIILADGYFQSPLTDILLNRDNQSINAYFYLWNIYQKYPNLINNAFHISVFQGMLANRASDQSSNINMDASLAALISAGVVDTKGKFTGGFSFNKAFNLTDWEMYFYLDSDLKPTLKVFQALPSPDDIIAVISKVGDAPTTTNSEILPFTKNLPHTHKIELRGVPKIFCEQKWSFELLTTDVFKPGSYNDRVNSIYKTEDGVDICECEITGTPADELFPANDRQKPIKLKYKLINSEKVANKELAIIIERVIVTSGEPRLVLSSNQPVQSKVNSTADGTQYFLKWEFPLDLLDKNLIIVKPVDNSGIISNSNIELTTSEGQKHKVKGSITYNETNRNKYQLILTSVEHFNVADDKTEGYETQTFSLDVIATAKVKGQQFDLPLTINNINIPFPKFEKKQ